MNIHITKMSIAALLIAACGCQTWQTQATPPWQYTSFNSTTSENAQDATGKSVVRGQNSGARFLGATTAGNGDYFRRPQQANGGGVQQAQFTAPAQPQGGFGQGGFGQGGPAVQPNQVLPNQFPNQQFQPPAPGAAPQPQLEDNPVRTLQGENVFVPPFAEPHVPTAADQLEQLPPAVDLDVFVEETRTGRFMFGMGVNSDLGVTGQIVIDERNFDWRRFPRSFDDIINGTAWRGAGQGFRLEAMPGTQVQRYLASFTEPYLYLPGIAEPFSLNLSGFFFDRRYVDWDEQRLGGRVALGYRVTHDLSLTSALRMENVNIHDPRVGFVPELNAVIGDNSLYSGRFSLTHDTRDTPFAATEGHLIELSYEQVFGTFDYPRGEIDYRQYFLVRERPDGSGRHSLSFGFRTGVSGSQTPIFENFFAGGFSTLRGFDFRGASPTVGGVQVGGQFRFLGSVEYMFPLTADDMVRGVVFCDYGTVERNIEINSENYRVAPGFGVRIAIPALGPAPLALDLAFPVAHAATDDIQNFSFFFGFGR